MGRFAEIPRAAWAACLTVWLGAACAAPPRTGLRAPSSSAGFSEHALAAEAEAARARAAAAGTDGAPGVLRGVQLRASGASVGDLEDRQNVTAGVRVLLERPWRVAAAGRGGKAEQSAANFSASAAALRARAVTCDESVQGRASAARQTLAQAHTAQLERALAWAVAFRESGSIDPLTASRTQLLLQRRLLAADAPVESFRVHDTLGALPVVSDAPGSALDRDAARVAERIRAQHPNVRAHLSLAEQNRQLSSAEMGRRIPWFDFVELDYGIEGQGFRDLQGKVALEIPLDEGSRGRSRRLSALGESEQYEAESEAVLLTQQALVSLHALQAFEAQAPRLAALLAQASEAESLALRFMDERREGPDKVAQLLGETYAGRLQVLEAQERAGRASCTLEWATGLSYAAWPRVAAP